MNLERRADEKMAYTPELNEKGSCTLRRIAWALKAPMTQTLETLLQILPKLMDKDQICENCRDKSRCDICAFGKANQHLEDNKTRIRITIQPSSPQ